jgi:hypothetical protein
MKTTLALILTLAATPARATPQTDYCVVTNPTPTPLTMRTSPNGIILGTLTNNESVEILDSTSDANGKLWVFLADANGESLGWIFRKFITCASDPGNGMKAQFDHCMDAQGATTNIAKATNGPEVWPLWAQFSKEECAQIVARGHHQD